MKAKKKQLTSDIAAAISEKLNQGSEATKKVTKAIEKAAEKLAKRITKLTHKAAEKVEAKTSKATKKAEKKAKNEEKKRTKNAEKALKNAKRAGKKKGEEPEVMRIPVATETSFPTEIEPAQSAADTTGKTTTRTRSTGVKAIATNKKTTEETPTTEVV